MLNVLLTDYNCIIIVPTDEEDDSDTGTNASTKDMSKDKDKDKEQYPTHFIAIIFVIIYL